MCNFFPTQKKCKTTTTKRKNKAQKGKGIKKSQMDKIVAGLLALLFIISITGLVFGIVAFNDISNSPRDSHVSEVTDHLIGTGDKVATSVFGRTGDVVGDHGDYTASHIKNTPWNTISAVTVQGAINELETEKQPSIGVGTDGQVLTTESGKATWASAPVNEITSVFSRTGVIVASSSDYTAAQITNIPSNTIAAATVQDAIDELEVEKQPNIGIGTDGQVFTTDGGEAKWATAASGSSSFKGVHASLVDANTNGISNTEGDYVIIYDIGTYTFTEGDIVIEYADPNTTQETLGVGSGGALYSTTALGITGTSNGEYFHVTSDAGATYVGYINNNGNPFATGLTGLILPAYNATVSGGLLVPLTATRSTFNTAVYHNGEYKYISNGYKGTYTSLADANMNAIRSKEGDYVTIVTEGAGFTLSEGDPFTVYQDPDTQGTTLSGYDGLLMYTTTELGIAGTDVFQQFLLRINATQAKVYTDNGTPLDTGFWVEIRDSYDATVNGLLAVPQTGLNVGANYGLARYRQGQYIFEELEVTEAERDALDPTDAMELYCSDCLDSGGDNAGVKQIYQLSSATWKNLY